MQIFFFTEAVIYTNCYIDFATKELHFTVGIAGINHCVQYENKFTS